MVKLTVIILFCCAFFALTLSCGRRGGRSWRSSRGGFFRKSTSYHKPSPPHNSYNPPSYGWNVPARPSPSYTSYNPPSYGWNVPARPSPSYYTSYNQPSYGWNIRSNPVQSVNSGSHGAVGPPITSSFSLNELKPSVISTAPHRSGIVKSPASIYVAPSVPVGNHRHIGTSSKSHTYSAGSSTDQNKTENPLVNNGNIYDNLLNDNYSDFLKSLPPLPKAHPPPSPSSSYTYTASHVGSGALGLFLGYSLGKIPIPNKDGSSPRYDHYEVHHYYHNKDEASVAKALPSNTIVRCAGDSGTICPKGTTFLCTSNGTIMCVVAASATVPCTENRQINCIKTVLPCIKGTECEDKKNNQTTVSIPCISNTKIEGNVMVDNNSIIISSNSTEPPTTSNAQNFCVTIVVVPAAPKTEGFDFEKLLQSLCDDMKRMSHIYAFNNYNCPLPQGV